MDDIADFARIVAEPDCTLDLSTTLIAALMRPPVDVHAVIGELDDIAESTHGEGLDGVIKSLFVERHFRGNVANYNDPENSMIDSVLRQRAGIPITLSIVMIEVARRVGIKLMPVSMPGHFLVCDETQNIFFDPFNGGRKLDRAACRTLHDGLFVGRRKLDDRELAPVALSVVLARVLNNLEQSRWSKDPVKLDKLLQLHECLPNLHPGEHLAIATRFSAVGSFGRAAKAAERASELLAGDFLAGDQLLIAQRAAAHYWGQTN